MLLCTRYNGVQTYKRSYVLNIATREHIRTSFNIAAREHTWMSLCTRHSGALTYTFPVNHTIAESIVTGAGIAVIARCLTSRVSCLTPRMSKQRRSLVLLGLLRSSALCLRNSVNISRRAQPNPFTRPRPILYLMLSAH